MQASAQWIAQATSGRLIGENRTVSAAVVTDSREALPGSLYVARQGENSDGHDYAQGAINKGAVALIVERPLDLPADIAQIVVDDSTVALGQLAHAHLESLRANGPLDVIAMTGSVGKTTTKDLLLQILSADGPTVAPKLSFNNEVGLPLTVLEADATTRHLVLEMGASGPGHITYLTNIASPDVVIELCVGHAHMGGFGGIEGVARAKAELIEGARPGAPVILNADDPRVAAMAPLASGPITRFSASGDPQADVRASDVRMDATQRASFTVLTPTGSTPVSLQIVGRHHVANALAAICGALSLGMDLETVTSTLSGAGALSPHRMDVRELNIDGVPFTLIDDSYNANLDSMGAGLNALKEMTHSRGDFGQDGPGLAIAVLGEMLELGEESASLHRQVGALAEEAGVQVLIGVGAEAHYYGQGGAGIPDRAVASSVEDAVQRVCAALTPGATVLVKGSFGSKSWQVADLLAQKGMVER